MKSAKELKEIANINFKIKSDTEFLNLTEQLEKAAKNGEFFIVVDSLTSENRTKLKNLGYKIQHDCYFGSDIISF